MTFDFLKTVAVCLATLGTAEKAEAGALTGGVFRI